MIFKQFQIYIIIIEDVKRSIILISSPSYLVLKKSKDVQGKVESIRKSFSTLFYSWCYSLYMKRLTILLSVDLPLLAVLKTSWYQKCIGLNGHASADKKHKVTNIRSPSEKLNVKFLIKQCGNFSAPLKRNVKIFQPPSSRSPNIFDPSHLSTTPLMLY